MRGSSGLFMATEEDGREGKGRGQVGKIFSRDFFVVRVFLG